MQNHEQKRGGEPSGFERLSPLFRDDWWKRRGPLALLLLFLCGGLIWFGVSGRDAGPPGVLSEEEFQEVTPYLFQSDRFYFWGKTENSSGYYIFDMKNGRLKKEDWTRQYGDSKLVYHLKAGRKVRILDDQTGRRLLLEGKRRKVKVTDSLPLVKQPVSISPKGDAFVYAEKAGSKLTLHLYTVESDRDLLLKKGVEETAVAGEDWVGWSAEGRYLLIGNEIYQSKGGSRIHKLPGHAGVWAPEKGRLAYVAGTSGGEPPDDGVGERPSLLGNRIAVLDLESKKSKTLYHTKKSRWIVGKPVWDPTGRYLTFPVGKQQDGETFFEEVHVTDGKLFHYVENEQNLLSTRMKDLTLSSGGDYLSYALNGILKLVDLRTLESRVYDVYNQVQSDPDYVRFDPEGVWLAQNHEILFVKDNMEEKRVYRTHQKILGFYLSGEREKLLVREETGKGQILRLIDLRNFRDAPENNS